MNTGTEGIETFIDTIDLQYEISDEIREFLFDFISNSGCKKIEFANFKMGVMGIALHNGVMINKMILSRNLEFLLFVIFHEIAHQYQFKKYGKDIMYNCYLGDISIDEAAKFMKETEEVADGLAGRKIRELQRNGLIDNNFSSPQFYKNVPITSIKGMVNNYREQMREQNITSPNKVSEFFYNMVKKEL